MLLQAFYSVRSERQLIDPNPGGNDLTITAVGGVYAASGTYI